ncbi:MAG: glyoxalase [Acidimicrobiales bacterium]
MIQGRSPVVLVQLEMADAASLWEGIGFSVFSDQIRVGSTLLDLGAGGAGITGWGLSGTDAVSLIEKREGIPTSVMRSPTTKDQTPHPNTAVQIDHVVLTTQNLTRTQHSLEAAGLTLRRTRQADASTVQCFYRMGEVILEVVGDPRQALDAAAALWGLICTVSDLSAAAKSMPGKLGQEKPAVQSGRDIAIVSKSAGLSVPCGFLSPHRN